MRLPGRITINQFDSRDSRFYTDGRGRRALFVIFFTESQYDALPRSIVSAEFMLNNDFNNPEVDLIVKNIRTALAGSRSRMILVVMATVLPAAAIIVHTGHEISVVVEEATRASAVLTARELALRFREKIESTRVQLEAVAALPESHLVGSRNLCGAWLAKAAKVVGKDEHLFLITPDGHVRCHSKPFNGSVQFGQRPFFKSAFSEGRALGAFQPVRMADEPAIALAIRVLDDSGSALAVVVHGLTDSELLGDFEQRAHLPGGSVIALLDNSGRIVASMPESADLKGMTANDFAERRKASAGDFVLLPEWNDNVPRLIGVSRLDGLGGGFFAAIAVPSTPIRASGEEENQRNLAILAAVSALVLAIGWTVLQRYVVFRARAIVQTADRLASGDLEARTGLNSDDGELNAIGRKIDYLAEVFQQSSTTARERRDALRRTNRALVTSREVSRLVAKAHDDVELARAACRVAVASGGYAMACVRLRGEQLRTIFRCVAREGVDQGYVEEDDVHCPSEQGSVRNSVFEAVETFPRRRSAYATNRPTRWESRSSCYATVFVNRSA